MSESESQNQKENKMMIEQNKTMKIEMNNFLVCMRFSLL